MRHSAGAGLLAVALLSGCRDAAVTEARVREARAAWTDAGVASYTIEVLLSDGGDLSRRVTVSVHDGDILRATMLEDEVERRPTRAQAYPYTVAGLFRILERELETDRRRFVRAWYHPELCYPERIELGPFDGPRPEASLRLLTVERFEIGSREPPP